MALPQPPPFRHILENNSSALTDLKFEWIQLFDENLRGFRKS